MTARPPALDEVEITILGPGRGESVLVHVGRGEWLIVDSCVTSAGEPAALRYLSELGISESSVRWIVASHWHDDHVRGFADLARACGSAEMFQSVALEHDEFLRLAVLSEDAALAGPSGVREMALVLRSLKHGARRPRFVQGDQRLFMSGAGVEPHVEIWSLSPSQRSLEDALQAFATLAGAAGEPKLAVPRPQRNPSSVVIVVQIDGTRVLLGGDLETSRDPTKGWQAIIDSPGRPTGRCQFVKVPHHGSKDAHHDGMWTELLEEEPYAVITPFTGGFRVPRNADKDRIARITPNAWLTHASPTAQRPKRSRAVERTIRETVRSMRTISIDPGRVTFRCPASNPRSVNVEAPWPAVRLSA